MPLSPYVSFAGNCAEATAFYQQAVGAELLYKNHLRRNAQRRKR